MNWLGNGWIRCQLGGFIVLCLPMLAAAQDEPDRDNELSEDLRVMSALVDETVLGFYQKLGAANCMACHAGNFNATELWRSQTVWSANGQFHDALSQWHFGAAPTKSKSTYIPGMGAVVQLTAPDFPDAANVNLQADVHAENLSRWEKMRRQLAGERTDKVVDLSVELSVDITSVHFSRNDLVDELAELLAESGHNFRHLAAEERIAVSVTFEKGAYDWHHWGDGTKPASNVWGAANIFYGTGESAAASGSEGAAGQGAVAGGEGSSSAQASGDDVPFLSNVPLLGELFRGGKRPLPVRLIVSATKAQVDAVASGTLSAEDFRKQVNVHLIDPKAKLNTNWSP
ncbi:MAG: hypothetical protein MPJ50_03730 [Pirellulales bacterium]|nr:hypothetical protein [Pirellulales bacterium]